MRRWLAIALLAGIFAFPVTARAQNPIKLSMLQVQLWPEYDQPSMLVIYDFKLPDGVRLPVSVSLDFPKEANLVAVASQSSDGSLLNTDYIGPTVNEAGQSVTIQIQTATVYHVEYYQPLVRTAEQREFNYVWPGDYAIDDISVSVRVPPNTTSIVTDPPMKSTKAADGSSNLIKDFGALPAGQQFPLKLTYVRTADTLSVPGETVQPSKPVGSNTPGRVLFSNYLPYILGVIGIVAIGVAVIYFLQPRNRHIALRRRTHTKRIESQAKSDMHCHQCGARAQPGDRFCRVCGTPLRTEE